MGLWTVSFTIFFSSRALKENHGCLSVLYRSVMGCVGAGPTKRTELLRGTGAVWRHPTGSKLLGHRQGVPMDAAYGTPAPQLEGPQGLSSARSKQEQTSWVTCEIGCSRGCLGSFISIQQFRRNGDKVCLVPSFILRCFYPELC